MIWPPSKAISTTTRSLSGIRDHLCKHSVGCVRVQERDLEPEEPLARLLVDQLDAFGRQLVNRSLHIGDLVGYVVHPGPPFRQELPHRRLLAQRRQELDPPFAHPQRGRFDSLVGNRLTVLEARAENPLVRVPRLVEVLDRHAEVMDPARLHAGDATWHASTTRKRSGATAGIRRTPGKAGPSLGRRRTRTPWTRLVGGQRDDLDRPGRLGGA